MGTPGQGIPFVGDATATDDSWMDALWQARVHGALVETLDVAPDLKAQMVQFLFSSRLWSADKLTWEAAHNRFNACLNPGKPEKFSTLELWALMRRFGRHQLFHAMADDLGYEVRRKSTPEREQELLARIARAIEGCNAVVGLAQGDLRRMRRERPALRVHGAIAAGNANFDAEGDDGQNA
jgi:hypothetical protein